MIAQWGGCQTDDLKVPGSIPGRGIFLILSFLYHYLISIEIPIQKRRDFLLNLLISSYLQFLY